MNQKQKLQLFQACGLMLSYLIALVGLIISMVILMRAPSTKAHPQENKNKATDTTINKLKNK